MSLILRSARRAALLLTIGSFAAVAVACSVSTPTAPSVSAPSEFGTSITLSATPEVLMQDGVSQAVITAIARDAASRPVKGLAIRWDATATTTRVLPVALSAASSLTDTEGRATILLTAPTTPTEAPFVPDFIIVNATPLSGSTDDVTPRTIRIELKAPAGVLTPNADPIARFAINPRVGIINEPIVFDASTTTDEGEPCLSRCTYLWDFGDGYSASGMSVTHAYARASVTPFVVTLTVRDDRGGIGSANTTLLVRATDLVARFTVIPASPQAGVEATFDASTSTVGDGSEIFQYTWDFGDGTSTITTTSTVGHVYAEARTYVVTLTLTPTATNGQPGTVATTAQTVTVR
jgi:PKD repeat protein